MMEFNWLLDPAQCMKISAIFLEGFFFNFIKTGTVFCTKSCKMPSRQIWNDGSWRKLLIYTEHMQNL